VIGEIRTEPDGHPPFDERPPVIVSRQISKNPRHFSKRNIVIIAVKLEGLEFRHGDAARIVSP